jgi:glutaredoxin
MVVSWLRSWWPWRRRRLTQWQVLMYTRQGCHLCEHAWELLCEAQRRYGFALSEADVDVEPALKAEYGEQVPVIVVNGRVRFRGVVNRILLERLLAAGERQLGSE